MTWEALLQILKVLEKYPHGQQQLKQPILVSNEEATRFLGIGGFQVLKDMQDLCVLKVNKDPEDAK